MSEIETFTSHLECAKTGTRHAADTVQGLSEAGWPLLVRYDMDGVRRGLEQSSASSRPINFWRYRELLPVRRTENAVSLGEIVTPLVGCPRLERELGVTGNLVVKDEAHLPTGSFKARGLALAVSMAKELGLSRLAMPSNGNAGAALAAYASRAGLESFVFCPGEETPEVNIREIGLQGGRVFRVPGQIDECGAFLRAGAERMGWFDVSTLKEPYRIEGKKTMGLELAEQFGQQLPDVIFYPTGGGTGLIGMWKAFNELRQIGGIADKMPRMVAVQAAGCAPIPRAFEAGAEHAERWENAQTMAAGIRVPSAIGDFLMLATLRESGGFAVAVADEAIAAAQERFGRSEGLLLGPEGAATFAAYEQALADGRVGKDERAVLFNCGSGLKYPMPDKSARLESVERVDWDAMAGNA